MIDSSRAFLSYVHEDMEVAEKVARNLQRNGIGVWRDKDELAGGMRWKSAIRQAISSGAFFISLHSKNRNARVVTYANEELLLAIEELRKRSSEKSWLIPIRIDGCHIEDRPIGGGETFLDLHVHDLREFESGMLALMRSMGVESPKIAEEKKAHEAGEFTAPCGSPIKALRALEELQRLSEGETFPTDALAAAFGRNTIADLSKLNLITSPERGYWKLANGCENASLALSVAILKIPAFQVVVGELKKNFEATGCELGAAVSEFLGRDWTRSSCQRNGHAYKKWVLAHYPNLRLPKQGERSYLQTRAASAERKGWGRQSIFLPDVLIQMSKMKRDGKSVSEMARELFISPQAIHNWKRTNPGKWASL